MGFAAFAGAMPSAPRSALVAAATAATGVALLGVAAHGVAGVDEELRAVTPPARFERVTFREDARRPAWDCPAPRRHAPAFPAAGEV